MISRQRRTLWRAVSAAEFAVLTVQQAGAQAGELDALCRRLRLAAEDADRHLPPSRRVSLPGRGASQPSPGISDLLVAAGMIQEAAASVITSLSGPAEPSEPADGSRAEDMRRRCEAIGGRIDSAARATAGLRECPGTGSRG